MNSYTGYHCIEAVIGEREFAHITIVHLDSISYTFNLSIVESHSSAVAALVYL